MRKNLNLKKKGSFTNTFSIIIIIFKLTSAFRHNCLYICEWLYLRFSHPITCGIHFLYENKYGLNFKLNIYNFK